MKKCRQQYQITDLLPTVFLFAGFFSLYGYYCQDCGNDCGDAAAQNDDEECAVANSLLKETGEHGREHYGQSHKRFAKSEVSLVEIAHHETLDEHDVGNEAKAVAHLLKEYA